MFYISKSYDSHKQVDAGHGRVETRKCDIICDLNLMDKKQEWFGLSRIVRVESERHEKKQASPPFKPGTT